MEGTRSVQDLAFGDLQIDEGLRNGQ